MNEYSKRHDSLELLPRSSGTATFVLYNKKHYLITARHLIIDTTYNNDNINIAQKIFLVESPQTLINHRGDRIDKYGNTYSNNDNDETFLMNIGYGGDSAHIFELSSSQQDLGIIGYLTKSFTNMLIKRGYVPITLSDIDTLCSIENGYGIMAIGYPAESEISNKGWLPKAYLYWEGWNITVPTISYGTIGDILKNENYFDGNIFVYHGFSGGPIIAKNKLVGITSGEGRETKSTIGGSPNLYFIHHSLFKKSSLIIPLLKKLESRLQRWSRYIFE